jgi:hypothetical protein
MCMKRWMRELAVVGVLYLFYTAARMAVDADLVDALRRGRDLLLLERGLGLAVEAPLSSYVAALPLLAVPACYAYALLHYTVTPGVLLWRWRAGQGYSEARTALAGIALARWIGARGEPAGRRPAIASAER